MNSATRILPLVLAIAACGSAPPRKPEIANTAKTPTKPVPCPDEKALAAIMKAALGSEAEEPSVLCIPLRRKGKAYWWLEGPAAPREDAGYVSTGHVLVDDQRTVVWKRREETDSFGYMYRGDGEAVDLDGDGNDEVLYGRTTGEGGMSRTELVIVHFEPAPGTFSIVLGMMGGAGESTCDGSWSVKPNGSGKLIDVTRTGNSCDAKEVHQQYDWQGKELPPSTAK